MDLCVIVQLLMFVFFEILKVQMGLLKPPVILFNNLQIKAFQYNKPANKLSCTTLRKRKANSKIPFVHKHSDAEYEKTKNNDT